MIRQAPLDMDALSRRTFLASLAATVAAGASPAVAVGSSPPPATVTEIIPLYVHHQCGGLLSFGKQYDDFSDMPAWTWRRRYALYSMGDHQGEELDAEALEDAREEFAAQTGVDGVALDEQEFLRWLDDPLPDNHGAVEDLFERWMTKEGPVGHAAQLIDLLGVLTPDGYDDGIYIGDLPIPILAQWSSTRPAWIA